MEFGKRPFRVHVAAEWDEAHVVNPVADRMRERALNVMGLEDLLSPRKLASMEIRRLTKHIAYKCYICVEILPIDHKARLPCSRSKAYQMRTEHQLFPIPRSVCSNHVGLSSWFLSSPPRCRESEDNPSIPKFPFKTPSWFKVRSSSASHHL